MSMRKAPFCVSSLVRSLQNSGDNPRGHQVRYPFVVIFVDIDNFKAYNDIYGYMAGDVVLQKTAEIIKKSIRTMDKSAKLTFLGGQADEKGTFAPGL